MLARSENYESDSSQCLYLHNCVQRSRLLEIAEKCPVGRTLTSEIQIKSRLLVKGVG